MIRDMEDTRLVEGWWLSQRDVTARNEISYSSETIES